MPSRQSRHSFLLIALVAAIAFVFYIKTGLEFRKSVPDKPSSASTPKYAFATFLSTRLSDESEDDKYFTSTRVLAYQLLHQPSTRSAHAYPLLVLTPPHVSTQKLKILRDEGCTVVPVEPLNPVNWTIEPGEARWVDQFTKLRVFELEQFSRILFMDSDMLLTRPLDDIWAEDMVIEPRKTKNSQDVIALDEALMPEDYVVAGVTDNQGPGVHHPAPITPDSLLNGGFLVLRPCKKLFHYYLFLLEAEPKFDIKYMEMGLLNYAHRHDGNMPWAPLPPGKWNSNWPSLQDLKSGSATLHDKFWVTGNKDWIDRELVEMWWRVQGRMEGFWQKKER